MKMKGMARPNSEEIELAALAVLKLSLSQGMDATKLFTVLRLIGGLSLLLNLHNGLPLY